MRVQNVGHIFFAQINNGSSKEYEATIKVYAMYLWPLQS